MIISIHILVAVMGLVAATYAFVRPTTLHTKISVAFIVSTIATGIALVLVNPSSMLHVCTSGFVYTITTTALTVAARRKYTQAMDTNKAQ